MKECHLKNIIGSIFFTLIIFFGSFNVKAERPNLEDSLVDTQRVVYYSLPLSSQNEIKDFYYSLEENTLQSRYHRYNRRNDFAEFLMRAYSFLNSEFDPQVRAKKAYIIGIANLEDLEDGSYIFNFFRYLKAYIIGIANLEDGSYTFNFRHLEVFTSSHPLDDVMRTLIDGDKLTINGKTIDCSESVYILTTNESEGSFQGVDPSADDSTGSRTIVKHDESFLNRLKIVGIVGF